MSGLFSVLLKPRMRFFRKIWRPVTPIVAVLFMPFSGCGNEERVEREADRIIVSGASGRLGTLVIRELLDRGVDPRNLILVSRTPEGLVHYAELGAATRYGDYAIPESLDVAYEGGTRMLLVSMNSGPPNRPELHNNAIEAAARVGVRHIVYTSSVDVDNMYEGAGSAADHRGTEDYLRASGMEWTMMRHQLYADGVVNQAARMIEDGQVVVQPDEVPTAFVTREDCAAAAAVVLTTAGHENQAYDITGPDVVLRREIATIASELTERPIRIVMGEAGLPQATGSMAGFAAFDRVSSDVERLIGRPAMSIEPDTSFLAPSRSAPYLASQGHRAVILPILCILGVSGRGKESGKSQGMARVSGEQ